jgi:hypothetical protein
MNNSIRFALVAALAFAAGWSLRTPVQAADSNADRSMRALEDIASSARRLSGIEDRLKEVTRVIERSEKEIKVTCQK